MHRAHRFLQTASFIFTGGVAAAAVAEGEILVASMLT